MSTRVLAGLAAGALLLASAPARADDPAPAPAKNWSLTVGAKGWANEWSTSLARYDIEGGNQIAVQSDSRVSAIPFISYGIGKWRVFGSYFLKTNYSFDTVTDVFDDGYGNSYYETITTSASRKEWDLNAGYQFNRHFLLALGYKEIDKDITSTRSNSVFTFFENPLRRQKATGPMLGLSANGDLTEGGKVKLYASAAIGSLKMKTDRPASTDTLYCPYLPGNIYCAEAHFSETQFYNNLEAGFVFTPHAVPVAYTLGYRYQSLRGDNKIADTSSTRAVFSYRSSDIIRGFTFGLSYTF